MALLHGISTIRGKIISVFLLLILVIQLGSSAFQYYQTRSILMEEFIRGSQNLVEPLFSQLKDQMKNSGVGDIDFTKDENIAMLDVYAQMMGLQQFESFLNAKKDLESIQFININNLAIVKSSKKADAKSEIVFASDEEKASKSNILAPELLSLVQSQSLVVAESQNEFKIFVPFFYKEVYLGGFILSHSNERINAVKQRIWMISLILILVYMTIAFTLVMILADRILTRPIRGMVTVVKQVAKGQLDSEITIKNRDEISEIAIALNGLIATLNMAFSNINRIMGAVSKGNLSQLIEIELDGDFNNLKDAINQSIRMLGETISFVTTICDQVTIGSSELSRVAAEISNNTNIMASTLEQISASMMEIEKNTKNNTQNSNNALAISEKTLDLVNRGNAQMASMMSSINKINATSMDVSKIIKAIDEIAFQTNLLALNAAVEAARAGKYGKGFAVVAEEVRNLAARSATAAKNTTELIENSLKEVRSGVENAEKTGSILSEITASVKSSNAIMSEITEASGQQSQGISEINVGIGQINTMVQKNSAVSQETAASSVELSSQANDLQRLIKQFTLLEAETETQTPTEINRQPVRNALPNLRLGLENKRSNG